MPPRSDDEKSNRRQDYSGQSAPVLAGQTIFVAGDSGYLYALNAKTGKRIWSYDLGVPIKSSPIVSGNMLLVHDYDGNLYAFVVQPHMIEALPAS